jgi:polyhydroxyalkanoate synthesis regulator protein
MTKILRLENRGGEGLLPNSSKTRLITFFYNETDTFFIADFILATDHIRAG